MSSVEIEAVSVRLHPVKEMNSNIYCLHYFFFCKIRQNTFATILSVLKKKKVGVVCTAVRLQ